MSKILYLGTSQFSEMMNTERWQLTNGMTNTGRYIFIDLKNHQGKNRDLYKLWVENNRPSSIILEDYDWAHKLHLPRGYINAHKVPVPVWSFIADYWYDPKEKLEYYINNNINGLIAIHEAANRYINENFGQQIKKIVNIPFSVDGSEFSDQPRQKEYDILCSGFMGDLYPLRQRIKDILRHNSKINTCFLEHPGYWKKEEKIGLQGRDYYDAMEKAKFVLSTTGRYNISVRKHIETIAARAKILGNGTGFREHEIFKDVTLLLDASMSDEQINDLIEEGVRNWSWSSEDENKRQIVLEMHDQTSVARFLADTLVSDSDI